MEGGACVGVPVVWECGMCGRGEYVHCEAYYLVHTLYHSSLHIKLTMQ